MFRRPRKHLENCWRRYSWSEVLTLDMYYGGGESCHGLQAMTYLDGDV